MKNFKIHNILSLFFLAAIFIIGFGSCSDDDSSSLAPLTVASVSKAMNSSKPSNPADNDSITAVGYPGVMYIIKGSGFTGLQKIYFNDKESYFNQTLVTDNTIFVTVDKNTPYENVSNELKIITSSGTITYPFIIGPPAPILTHGFNPVNAVAGDEITIYGNYFLNPIVTIGTTPVELVSSSMTQIVVKLPADSDNKYISVSTISGKVTSTYAIGSAIYDDTSYYGLGFPAWNNQTYVTDGTADQGKIYMKIKLTAWSAFQGDWSWYDKLAPYGGIRVAIKAKNPGAVKFCFNGDWGDATSPLLSVTTEWKTFYIPWS